MVINFFLQSKDFGGAEKFAHDLSIEIGKQNNFINFYTNNAFLLKNLNNVKNVQVKKIPIYLDFAGNGRGLVKSVLLTPLAIIYFLKVLNKIKKSTEKQVLICSGFSEKIILAPLAKMFDLPVFFIEYGPLSPIFKKLFGIPKLLYYLSKNFAKKIIVPSNNTRIALQNILSKEKIVLIQCGTPSIKSNSVKIKPKTIVVTSRLEKGKGQDLAIQAFFQVKKKFPNVKLLIIGKGNFGKELKRLGNDDTQIKFLDYVENKQRIIEESEIVLCPSVWPLEGFGLTIIEAMALGKAIIAFDRAPGNEMLANNQNALLAKDGDYQDLAKQIISLFKDKNLAKKIAKNAQVDFAKNYQIDKIAKKYLTLLNT